MLKYLALVAALLGGTAAHAFDQSHVRLITNNDGPTRVTEARTQGNACLIFHGGPVNIAIEGQCEDLRWVDVLNGNSHVTAIEGVNLDQRVTTPVEYLNRDGGYETNEDYSRREFRLTAELENPATTQERRRKIEQVMRWEGNKRLQATARFYRLFHECLDESTPYERKLEIRQNLNNTNEYVAELHEAHTGVLQFCR